MPTVHAETLPEALAAAYQASPRIESARARLQALEESIAVAASGYLPRVTASADATSRTDGRVFPVGRDTRTDSSGYALTLVQPLYDGGRAGSAVQAARANVRAEKETLQIAVQQVLLAAATAYMDILQSRRLLKLNEESVVLLSKISAATLQRAGVREATTADVAQADAALAGARAQVELAKADLAISEAAYLEVMQHPPGGLSRPPSRIGQLPPSLEAALRIADRESPVVILAIEREVSARHAIDQARSHLYPTISLQAGYQRRSDPQPAIGETDGLVAKVVVTVPLYSGGGDLAEVRAAQHNQRALAHQVADTRLQARTAVVQSWARLASTRAAGAAIATQVAASRKALAGIRAEHEIGQRSLLDLLNTQQALIASETTYERTQRSLIVNAYAVLGSIGRLVPEMADASVSNRQTGDRNADGSSWATAVRIGK